MVLQFAGGFGEKGFDAAKVEQFRQATLLNDEVAEFVNDHFHCTYLRVGSPASKSSSAHGNVVTYICLSDMSVVHAILGPVAAGEFLREARWIVGKRQSAVAETKGDPAKCHQLYRKAHAERCREELANTSGLAFPSAFRDSLSDGAAEQPPRAHDASGKDPLALGPPLHAAETERDGEVRVREDSR